MRNALHSGDTPLRALWKIGNLCFSILVFVVATFEIDGGEARLKRSRRNGFQTIAPCAPDQRGGGRDLVWHLRCNRAPPNQRVHLQLAFVDIWRGEFGGECKIRWANRLVRLLCILRLRGVLATTLYEHLWAESFADDRRRVADGLLAQRWRVGTHIGNETGALAANLYTLVELLGELHRDA